MTTTVTPLSIQQEYWAGLIPIQLSLAPTSVSSPTLPPPIHVLVSRCTYLHVALEFAVRRFHPFAPNITSFTRLGIQEPEVGAKDERLEEEEVVVEEESGRIGAADHSSPRLYKFNHQNIVPAGSRSSLSAEPPAPPPQYPICWFEDEETNLALRWHFFVGILYDMLHPSGTVETTHSSGQSSCTRQSNRIAVTTQRSSSLPWKLRLHFTNYPSSQLLPLPEENLLSAVQFTYKNALKQAIAILTGSSKAAMQVTKESHGLVWEAITTGDCELYHRVELPAMEAGIPIRLLVGHTNPPIQKIVPRDSITTLRELLRNWYPEFESLSFSCTICGIELPTLDDPTLDILYNHCYSPDRFLYILLVDHEQ